MSAWLDRQFSSHRVQLVATAVVSGIVVAGAIISAQAIRRKVAIEDLKASIPNIDEDDSHVHEVRNLDARNALLSSSDPGLYTAAIQGDCGKQ